MKSNHFIFPLLLSIFCLTAAFVNPPVISEEESRIGNQEFYEFLSQFEKVELPYEVDIEQMSQYEVFRDIHATQKEKTSIPQPAHVIKKSSYIPELVSGRFSRMGPPLVEPVARFYPNDKMIAIIYKTSNRYSNGLFKEYNIHVFDLKGNPLSTHRPSKKKNSKMMARETARHNDIGYSSIHNTATFRINKQGQIIQTVYKNIWQKDVAKVPFQENILLGFEKQNALVYQITPTGTLAEVSTPTDGTRASLD